MSLQPTDRRDVDRTASAPFLLRCFWKQNRDLNPNDFSVAPPIDPASQGIADYSQILPSAIRQQSVQIYTWPTCTLSELTGLLASVLPEGLLPKPAAGTRLVYKLIFPDTRAEIREGGRGKWLDKPLGSVVIGGRDAQGGDEDAMEDVDALAANLMGDSEKTLADARFVIGDYVACAIYPPGEDGRVAPLPPPRFPSRDPYDARGRGPPPQRENGYGGGFGGGGYGRGGGGYRGGYGGGRGGNGFGGAPPMGDWRRGERPPDGGYGGGYGRGRGGRPY